MGKILDNFTRADSEQAPTYRYDSDNDLLFRISKIYVECDDRLSRLGFWLYSHVDFNSWQY